LMVYLYRLLCEESGQYCSRMVEKNV